MTTEEINVAIAELCGWKRAGTIGRSMYPAWKHSDGRRVTLPQLPRYANDLNAMHEAEKTFDGDDMDTRSLWYDTLAVCCEWPKVDNAADLGFEVSYRQARATARQRAEAFLRVKGKWKE